MWRGKPRKDILLPINHWDYCSDPTCTRCRKLTLSIPKKIHQQLTRNRRLHYDLYMTTRLLTCSVQMLSVAVGKMIGCISRRAWEVVRNTVRHECRSTFPSPISKKKTKKKLQIQIFSVFFQTCGESPVTHPAKNVVRRKMPILFFSG